MLKKMVLINSANFQFADIDLSKEIFFVGDNASGKTTTTRALHFLYNGDGQKLGIPNTKDTFAQHYFPDDDSYIIYIFESFFIFTYKRNNTIKRWFSKQEFNIHKIFRNNNNETVEFKEIENYIKEAPLRRKPETIEEYTSILYGNSSKYLDFSIAKISNTKIFLDIFNMIFNIDKAIVTARDIKEAIQKSLDRKDEVLNIDYDDFIRKLNNYSKSYHFFKTFDKSRISLKDALDLKDELLSLEKEEKTKRSEIAYRFPLEVAELNTLADSISTISQIIAVYKKRTSSIESMYSKYKQRVSIKIKKLEKEVIKLEALKEKFDPLDVEENTTIANQYDGIKKELNDKNFSLNKLKEAQTTAEQEIETQIEQIIFKIDKTIPNEMRQNFFKLSEEEKATHQSIVYEIEGEYEKLRDEVDLEITAIENVIKIINENTASINSSILKEQEVIKEEYRSKLTAAQTQKQNYEHNADLADKKIKRLEGLKQEQKSKISEHEKRYVKLRRDNAKILASKRISLNKKIVNARAIVNPPVNSFNAFLSSEVDGWEQSIYPIIDKDLLKLSCDELQPKILDAELPLGFKINTDSLASIPTKDEALRLIEDTRKDKVDNLKSSKEAYRATIGKFDEEKNGLLADLESYEKEIDNLMEEFSRYNGDIFKAKKEIDSLSQEQIEKIDLIDDKYRDIKKNNGLKKEEQEELKKKKRDTIKILKDEERESLKKSKDDRDFNIEIIKKRELKEAHAKIAKAKKEIELLNKEKNSLSEDDMIAKLSSEVKLLDNQYRRSLNAIEFIEQYEESRELIANLPLKEKEVSRLEKMYQSRESFIEHIDSYIRKKIADLQKEKTLSEEKHSDYDIGIKKVKELKFDMPEEKLESSSLLRDLIVSYDEIVRVHGNQKSKLRTNIDRLKKLESYSFVEVNFNMHKFDEVDSISELDTIVESLNELDSFEKNKYQSQKKRNHNDFKSFLSSTIPGRLQSLDDLESEFEKAKNLINRNLSHANFGVIKDIRLVTDSSKSRNDSIKSLLDALSKKVQDTIGLYSNESLFYHDVPRSIGNIDDIESILQDIKKKAASNSINLLDTIDLSMSYIENGKKVENKLNIKDESSSGGNILLKVAIAMSILSRYTSKKSDITPFFLIIDEISKLQNKNQDLIRGYINENGFRTLFITPDPAYPNPERAIYYTFKNIQEEGESLEIRQMNII